MSAPLCRSCGTPLERTFVDLGSSPLANSFLEQDQLHEPEIWYPLRVFVCTDCWLVQLPDHVDSAEIFSRYAYFSSVSMSWVEHARRFAETAIERLRLHAASRVVEAASNDGYLLQHFARHGIAVLGIEPAANVAEEARRRGIPTEVCFLGRGTAATLRERGVAADLLVANNVLAHVPDLHDFVGGLEILLAPGGTLTLEFPHLLRLIDGVQFDTIYHEHFSYFSFHTAERVLSAHGIEVYDVEELTTHGGSLRVWAGRRGEIPATSDRVADLRQRERLRGVEDLSLYQEFGHRVERVRHDLLEFLLQARKEGKRVLAYGAPAKGNTLLVYSGVRTDLVSFTVDRSPHKQGRYLPGSRLPILPPDAVFEVRPDFLLILPWNLREEIVEQMGAIREWGGRFLIPLPQLEIF